MGVVSPGSEVALRGRHRVLFLVYLHRYLVKAPLSIGLVGHISQQIPAPQLLGDQVVYRFQIILLARIVGVAPCPVGDLLHDLPAVHPGIAGAMVSAAPAVAPG